MWKYIWLRCPAFWENSLFHKVFISQVKLKLGFDSICTQDATFPYELDVVRSGCLTTQRHPSQCESRPSQVSEPGLPCSQTSSGVNLERDFTKLHVYFQVPLQVLELAVLTHPITLLPFTLLLHLGHWRRRAAISCEAPGSAAFFFRHPC